MLLTKKLSDKRRRNIQSDDYGTQLARVDVHAIDDMRFIMGNEKCLTLYILRLENKRCSKKRTKIGRIKRKKK